ncbi:hypothetical protein SAMN05421640_1494 [Ekhidna lutea]|uniref:Uncharacterized protein n=1 Tax=Ekhidna lutea TaxID=447679 RepID=A0A239HTP8_EKHLU|nr:hypothetical protein SAMN05421640_1494 [Ekhidna lutea]
MRPVDNFAIEEFNSISLWSNTILFTIEKASITSNQCKYEDLSSSFHLNLMSFFNL